MSSVGGCLRGAVRFAAGEHVLFCVHCHCAWCRRAHGAAFVTWYGVKEIDFKLTSGVDTLRFYKSSNESERGFCTNCGTTLFFRSSVAAGEMHIALACADDANAVGKAPSAHVFYDAHVSWIEGAEALPKYDRHDAGVSKYQVIPQTPSSPSSSSSSR
jgi:hypothetical protein